MARWEGWIQNYCLIHHCMQPPGCTNPISCLASLLPTIGTLVLALCLKNTFWGAGSVSKVFERKLILCRLLIILVYVFCSSAGSWPWPKPVLLTICLYVQPLLATTVLSWVPVTPESPKSVAWMFLRKREICRWWALMSTASIHQSLHLRELFI